MALATTAGARLVTAMAEDGWQALKAGVARLLGRGDPEEEARQEARLERSREDVVGLSGTELEQARERQSTAWRTRFEDLLEDSPDAADQLRDLVEFLGGIGGVVSGAVQVNAQASGHAQQAVQGQGVQTNTFTTPSQR
jgi:hypothetical protein